jgi:hypothetical protein
VNEETMDVWLRNLCGCHDGIVGDSNMKMLINFMKTEIHKI